MQQQGYRGIYIEGFGLGGMPFLKRDFVSAVKKAVDNGMTILAGSQCPYEGSNLSVYETGLLALKNGVLQAFDIEMADFCARRAKEMGFPVTVEESSLGGDDFAFYEEKIPGCYIKIGTGIGHPIHHPAFMVKPEMLLPAAKFLSGLILGDQQEKSADKIFHRPDSAFHNSHRRDYIPGRSRTDSRYAEQ